jgi:hypothetical protein
VSVFSLARSLTRLDSQETFRNLSSGLLAIVATVIFFRLRTFVDLYVVYYYGWSALAIGWLAFAVCFYKVTYSLFPIYFSTLTRFSAIGVLLCFILDPPNFTLADERHWKLAAYVNIGFWVGLAVSVASLFRPSFLYPAAFYIISTRHLIEPISGFPISALDIRYLIDMAQFLACAACGLALLEIAQERFRRLQIVIDRHQLTACLVFVAIGFHFGNYFWSGYEKLVIGPHFWTWTLENATHDIMLGALKRGVLPSGALPELTQFLYGGLLTTVVVANILTVGGQLAAIVAPFRVQWMRLSTWGFDLLHVGIYRHLHFRRLVLLALDLEQPFDPSSVARADRSADRSVAQSLLHCGDPVRV